jgi:5,6-dimethylbenzimidazole synthase
MVRFMDTQNDMIPPTFGADFQDSFDTLLKWRRDVRRFKPDPVPEDLLRELLGLAALAPSVGNSQPWRFASVQSNETRQAVRKHFQTCNAQALNDYHGEQAKLYAQLKLSGMDQAPTQIAVFCDQNSELGHGLGKKTMPETLNYSVVMAVHTLWLAARARGIGVGWVSILEPRQIETILSAPEGWAFVAYLCIGWPEEEHDDPELVRYGWQERVDVDKFIIQR